MPWSWNKEVPDMAEIKLIINGKECVGQTGQTILEVAQNNGIFMPSAAMVEQERISLGELEASTTQTPQAP